MANMDPETSRHIEAAKESLVARAEELGRRYRDTREKLDIPAHIAAHPMVAIGIAAAAGLVLGFLAGPGSKRPQLATSADDEVKRGLIAAGAAALGSLAIQFAKDFAVRQIVNRASHWIDERELAHAPATEAATSRVPDTESFFRH